MGDAIVVFLYVVGPPAIVVAVLNHLSKRRSRRDDRWVT